MPCNTVIESKVADLGSVNLERLARVLAELGWTVSSSERRLSARRAGLMLTINSEGATFTGLQEFDADENASVIKRAYAASVVADAAKRFGWRVKGKRETENKTTHLKLGR